MADARTLLRAGREASEKGKHEQAVKLLSAAVAKLPAGCIAWFSLATAHGRAGAQDAAALCFLKAHHLFSQSDDPKFENVAQICHNNLLLTGEKVLGPHWLPAANDRHMTVAWGAGIATACSRLASTPDGRHAPDISAASSASGLGGAAASKGAVGGAPPHVCVLGGLGSEAVAAVRCLRRGAAAAAAGSKGAGSVAGRVTSLVGDKLSEALVAQVAAANGCGGAIAATTSAEGLAVQRSPPVGAVIAAGMCTASLGIARLHRALASIAPALAPQVALCPARILIRGSLVESKQLVEMNEVDCEAMKEDTGLDYRRANELLWRPHRPIQVDRFEYRPLSQPFTLLTIEPSDLLPPAGGASCSATNSEVPAAAPPVEGDAALGAAAQPKEAAAAASAGAAAATAAARRSRHIVQVTAAGRLDAVVWWMEYEMAPNCRLSFAPQGLGGRPAALATQPHLFQHVAYLRNKQEVQAAFSVQLQATLTPDDSLELSCTRSAEGNAGASAGSRISGGGGGSSAAEVSAQSNTAPASVQSSGGDAFNAGNFDSGSGGDSGNAILPYHLSMLNDRPRTQRYRDGIRAAVTSLQRALQPVADDTGSASSCGSGSSAAEGGAGASGAAATCYIAGIDAGSDMTVLDIGSGTGLLSMMAAGAGAPLVVGCEREPLLARTAGALLAANGYGPKTAPTVTSTVTIHQKLSNELSVSAVAAAPAEDAAPAEAGGPAELPLRANLVVHEIFGTDPLSEHVLPAMRDVQQRLAAPGAVFVPSDVAVVAALARSETLLRLGALPAGGGAGIDLSPLQALAPRKVEVNVTELTDLVLLSKPCELWRLPFNQRPLPLHGSTAAAVDLLSAPMHIKSYAEALSSGPAALAAALEKCSLGASEAGGAAAAAPSPAAQAAAPGSAPETSLPDANCIVHWFEADCGAGGVVSTAPGTTPWGHWVQNVELLAEGFPLGEIHKAGLMAVLQLQWAVDRVTVAAFAAQPADEDDD